MGVLEGKIKAFLQEQGVEVAGIAGPESLDGPPSLDPAYTLPGARSIVSMALPMKAAAIHDFLGKKTPVPHNLDQTESNQRMHRIGARLADYIGTLGYGAAVVPPNNTYRRSPDVYAMHPSFSHRFGAIAAGIGGHGWSGNVMTEAYGASIYLGTVVTDAHLESDPARYSSRHFVDNYCAKCRRCSRVCVAGMFEAGEEEYVLLNGRLHPRGRRRDIDLCNAACFGLHSLSQDRKWTTWGHHWIRDWTENPPREADHAKVRRTMLAKGGSTGDSTPRYDIIRKVGAHLHPEEMVDRYLSSHSRNPGEAEELPRLLEWANELGVLGADRFGDSRILTCGHCALICGPTLDEKAKRYNRLIRGGLVVPGPAGVMINVSTYAEALELRRRHMPRVSKNHKIRDAAESVALWHKLYFGLEPAGEIRGLLYDLRLRLAVRAKVEGHRSENQQKQPQGEDFDANSSRPGRKGF